MAEYTQAQAFGRAKQLAAQFNRIYAIVRIASGSNANDKAFDVLAYDSPVFAADYHATGDKFKQVRAYALPRGELVVFWSF